MKGAVWYNNYESGCNKLTDIINEYVRWYGEEIIENICKSKNEYYVEFKNGDFWKIIRATDSARGHKVNISYIDHNISKVIQQCIIKPCTIASPFRAFNYY